MATTKPNEYAPHCEAMVVHCMDYRLQKFLHPWISGRFGYDNFDIISIPGSVHNDELVLKYVQLAIKIHSITTVYLINHEGCGAYGEAGTYERHRHDLLDTREKLKQSFPQLNVETFYLHLDGTFEPIE